MKAPYEELEFEVIRFTVEDIITTSNAQTDDDDKDQDQDQTDQDDQGGNEDEGGKDDGTTPDGTSGKYYYGPDDVRSESHVLDPSPENDYKVGGEVYWPAYTDENGDVWFLTDGGYVLATNPDNFV